MQLASSPFVQSKQIEEINATSSYYVFNQVNAFPNNRSATIILNVGTNCIISGDK